MSNTEILMTTIEKCGQIGATVLNGDAACDQYVNELRKLIGILKNASDDDITATGYPANIKNTVRMDRYLINDTVTEEPDQLSLLSTLVTYVACYREGMPEHSREYMDRVTALRKEIEQFYEIEAMRFCGSDGC